MFARCTLLCAIVSLVIVGSASSSFGQSTLYSDTVFNAADYDTSGAGNGGTVGQYIKFNYDYSSYDIFGDGFLTNSVTGIPVAPRTTDGSRTGLFLTANNDSTIAGAESLSAVIPKNLNIGTGTANPNYVMRVDVFNSTGAGIDVNGDGTLTASTDLIGTTNYAVLGVNQANTTVQIRTRNAPGATGNLAGQGLAMGVTADGGAAEDYMPIYGGALYIDRKVTTAEIAGQYYDGDRAGLDTGLLGKHLNNYWSSQPGLGFTQNTTGTPAKDLIVSTGDSLFFAPDPANPAAYLSDGTGTEKSLLIGPLPKTTAPLHYANTPTSPGVLVPNGSTLIPAGIPSNRWSTHELYWVDNKFTYVIDGVPVLQITPDASGDANDNVFSQFSSAGSTMLAFYDRFASIATSPEGANFVIYDNLEIKTATAAEVPSVMSYLAANGFLLASNDADFNDDGTVDGADLLIWQQGLGNSGGAATGTTGNANADTVVDAADLGVWQSKFGGPPATAAAGAVPEPTTCVLTGGLLVGLALRRRRA
jgi:hypothetical protein